MAELIKGELPAGSDASNEPVSVVNTTNAASTSSATLARGKVLQATTPGTNADIPIATIAVISSSGKGKMPRPPEEFYRDLQQFHERRATPIMYTPKISGRQIDLHKLYCEVTERGGFYKVNQRDEWDEVIPALGLRESCVNATAAIKYIYRRCLEKYEKQNFLGEDPDKMEALESVDAMEGGSRSRSRYPPTLYSSSGVNVPVNAVPMSYNYRQHIVNMDRRRTYKLSTDLHKSSPYERLMLSLISPLPNEQDFAINVCSLMANENKLTLKLNEYPKILDMLLAHTGVFPDYTLRKLFQHVYTQVREHSLFGFWRDLLSEKPQILDLYTDEQIIRDAGLINDIDDSGETAKKLEYLEGCKELDFLNLQRSEGTQDFVGQRLLQIVAIFRNLSFFEENLTVFAKNRTFIRFIVMGANIRWGNLHNQILDIAGNIATEIDLLDPSTDDVSRTLLATLCDGVESLDRGVIINSLEILYKLCQKDSNEEQINKCLNLKFYETICQFLCLNDIMLLIFTLEAIYALTSMGTRSCHLIMQVRGIVDQLVSLITVEAQSYGPDGCILMRVVETVPGNMLPMIAQNIANLQNAAVIQKPIPQVFTAGIQLPAPQPPLPTPVILPAQIQAPVVSQPQIPMASLTGTDEGGQNVQQPLQDRQVSQVGQANTTNSVTQPQQQNSLITTAAKTQPSSSTQMQHIAALEDEQYALAWLGATFERTPATESHIEQQELYRIYLTHCQKSSRQSFVNHVQFPKLVRLIFSNNAGPSNVRLTDGTCLSGQYVGIRLRAQPLPIQLSKCLPLRPPTPDVKIPTNSTSGESTRKMKKKLKLSQETLLPTTDTITSSTSSNATLNVTTNFQESENTEQSFNDEMMNETDAVTTSNIADSAILIVKTAQGLANIGGVMPVDSSAQPSSSLIKSLLANKVTQRQQKNQKEVITTVTSGSTAQTNVATIVSASAPQQPIKVGGTAISAFVNNPLIQSTPVKVGQTTIKPLNPQNLLEKKPVLESTPPPLAPLSGNNVAKDSSGRPVIIANQMLVDILDKKGGELPIPATIIKRKIEDSSEPAKRLALDPFSIASKDEMQVTPSKNAANLYAEMAASILEDEDLEDIPPLPVTTSTLASTSVAELNESIQHQQHQQILIPAKIQQAALQSVPRQLLFQTNQTPQLKLTTHGGVPTAMATIKTDQGLQTVPVILQQKPIEHSQSPQQLIQQVITQGVPQAIPQQQQPTQYVLATNQQGQTYLVAQQPQPPPPPPPQQTVLVTQTPQQQSTGQKTIIILQQQSLPGQQTLQSQSQLITSGGQKMIMTTPQGQQVLVTQRQQPTLTAHPTTQQYFINPQTGAATPIQHVPTVSASGITTNVSSSNQLLQRHQIIPTSQITTIATTQPVTGQMSQSLLSQLNHIPATIKLHQPQMTATSVQSVIAAHHHQQQQQHQSATISRLGKTVSIVQATPAMAAPPQTQPIQIPQLQQHQSIIQQHIISGPSEKRQVILGGRPIEIKETLITQAPPPTQQSQLNSQTIITKQVLPQQQHQQQKILPKPAEHSSLIQTTLPCKTQSVVQTVVQQQTAAQPSFQTNKIPMAQPVRIPTPQHQQAIAPIANNSKTITSEPPPLTQTTSIRQTPQQSELSKSNETTNITNTTSTNGSTVVTATVAASKPATPPPPPPSTPQRPPSTTAANASQQTPQTPLQNPTPPIPQLPPLDPNWLFVCDWRNCPRRKFKSLNDLHHHACTLHCPDHLEPSAEIFCQWGVGPGLCDGIPRKRFSLMTHIIDRHLTNESLRSAMQRRIATGTVNIQPAQSPVTIVRNVEAAQAQAQRNNTSSPAPSTSSSSSSASQPIGIGNATGSSAMHAIKRHTADYLNPKELMDENEGPVTKSIRLTAALILRNLVTYNNTAKRSLRSYEPHLSNVALSNVESSVAISHILYEINN